MFQALHFHPYNFPKEALVRSKVDEALSAQQESEAYSVQILIVLILKKHFQSL